MSVCFNKEFTINNALAIKCILKSIELVFGLNVNFYKSCLIKIKGKDIKLRQASLFLNCRVGTIPFKFLGISVGLIQENPSRGTR